MNSIVFGEIKGDRQKSTDYSEDISSEDYILSLTSSKKKGHMKFMKMVVSDGINILLKLFVLETEITG